VIHTVANFSSDRDAVWCINSSEYDQVFPQHNFCSKISHAQSYLLVQTVILAYRLETCPKCAWQLWRPERASLKVGSLGGAEAMLKQTVIKP